MIIFAVTLLMFLTGIIVFTAAFGRLWCGWTCPQTVLMEMVFRKIEYLIEGDAHQQRALDKAPWTAAKLGQKLLQARASSSACRSSSATRCWPTSSARSSCSRSSPTTRRTISTGLTFMILFTLLFYAIFARFREQACTFICPYGRFQSTLLDENTIVVAYDYKRGEKRGPLHRGQDAAQRRAAGRGDCIDCHAMRDGLPDRH